jgi:hypothetical protein
MDSPQSVKRNNSPAMLSQKKKTIKKKKKKTNPGVDRRSVGGQPLSDYP